MNEQITGTSTSRSVQVMQPLMTTNYSDYTALDYSICCWSTLCTAQSSCCQPCSLPIASNGICQQARITRRSSRRRCVSRVAVATRGPDDCLPRCLPRGDSPGERIAVQPDNGHYNHRVRPASATERYSITSSDQQPSQTAVLLLTLRAAGVTASVAVC